MARRQINGGLRWRPIVPGSDLHCDLMSRTSHPLRRVLYPSLDARRVAEAHRRACAVIAASAGKVAPTKAETPGSYTEGFTAPRPAETGDEDGCSSECA